MKQNTVHFELRRQVINGNVLLNIIKDKIIIKTFPKKDFKRSVVISYFKDLIDKEKSNLPELTKIKVTYSL